MKMKMTRNTLKGLGIDEKTLKSIGKGVSPKQLMWEENETKIAGFMRWAFRLNFIQFYWSQRALEMFTEGIKSEIWGMGFSKLERNKMMRDLIPRRSRIVWNQDVSRDSCHDFIKVDHTQYGPDHSTNGKSSHNSVGSMLTWLETLIRPKIAKGSYKFEMKDCTLNVDHTQIDALVEFIKLIEMNALDWRIK